MIRAAGGTGGLHGPVFRMKPDRRVSCLARWENFKAVSGTERLAWPPAWGKGARISGRAKKRSGAADLKF